MMKRKPVIGETLYLLDKIRSGSQKLTPVIVESVGKKYFVCKRIGGNIGTKFHIDTWTGVTEYVANGYLYETPQEWEDEKELNNTIEIIRDALGLYGGTLLNLDQLRRIKIIIEEKSG